MLMFPDRKVPRALAHRRIAFAAITAVLLVLAMLGRAGVAYAAEGTSAAARPPLPADRCIVSMPLAVSLLSENAVSVPLPLGCLQKAMADEQKTATAPIIAFEIFIVVASAAILTVISRYQVHIMRRYWVMALGVLIFEVFTAPMWHNDRMGFWAYLYRDVSWVLTMGWATMIFTTIIVLDAVMRRAHEWQRVLAYLVLLTALVVVFERIVVALGIRSYSPEVMANLEGTTVPILGVSYHQLYYVPVFLALVIAFYEYWIVAIDMPEPAHLPLPLAWLLGIAVLGVFLFEIMIEPMVVNQHLPSWSYVYHDISVLMTSGWVLAIWAVISLVDRVGAGLGPRRRFVAYLVLLQIIVLPLETWLIQRGFRVYGPSATGDFSGIQLPGLHTPIEVAFAIPLYMALVIGFIRYWERVLQDRAREAQR